MIVFDLKCSHDHRFEAWFRSSSDYEDQRTRGLLACPICGDGEIAKAVMAPNVTAKSNQTQSAPARPDAAPAPVPTAPAAPNVPVAKPPLDTPQLTPEAVRAMVTALHDHVTKTADNVGDRFADEARAIHYGDKEERGIYGSATKDEVIDLMDEGIEILPLPDKPKSDA